MRRNMLHFGIDILSFVTMIGMICTGLVMKFTLPPRTGGRLSVWGMDRHEWGGVHFWLAAALLAILLLHVALNWSWVCTVVRRTLASSAATTCTPAIRRRRRIYGIATLAALVALVGGFQWIAAAGVSETRGEAGPALGHRRGEQEGRIRPGETSAADEFEELRINGATTIGELAAELGLSIEQVAAGLGLPGEQPPDARLGRLCRAHGISMSDVRRAAAKLRGNRRGASVSDSRRPEDCDRTEP